MTVSRRTFVAGAATAATTALARPLSLPALTGQVPDPRERFDPWLEIDPEALRYNVSVISRLSGGRPIMAVIKNNAYGLGLTKVATVLEDLGSIMGFAVVKTDAAIALRDAGIRKPILLLGLFSDASGPELLARDVDVILGTDDSGERVVNAARRAGRAARVHAYLDTGMSRMGIPCHRALPWFERMGSLGLEMQSTFMAFTEVAEFDREQLRRFNQVTAAAAASCRWGPGPHQRGLVSGHRGRERQPHHHRARRGAFGVHRGRGDDDPAIRPNALAAATGRSVYDILMHLNPVLPKVIV